MPKKEVPVGHLQEYLPPDTAAPILEYLHRYKVHLTITQHRKSILGDYRHRTFSDNHRISVNGSLNPFAFLITLLHELAHLLTFEQHGNKVQSHGREWKIIYGGLLKQFLEHKIFPADIERELRLTLQNPAATSCAEDDLLRVLRKYDPKASTHKLIEEIPLHSLFKTDDGRVFRKGQQLRKRFQCKEVATEKMYLFSPVYEVMMVNGEL
jgi:SprT protein